MVNKQKFETCGFSDCGFLCVERKIKDEIARFWVCVESTKHNYAVYGRFDANNAGKCAFGRESHMASVPTYTFFSVVHSSTFRLSVHSSKTNHTTYILNLIENIPESMAFL